MRDEIIKFSQNYDNERRNMSFGDPSSSTYTLLVKEIPEQIRKYNVVADKRLKVKGSCGQGQWTFNPWICIFDLDVTSKASEGYYIVYLFDDQRKYLYLSINQAWTPYAENRNLHKTALKLEAAGRVANEWRNLISDELRDMRGVNSIHLTSNSKDTNALGYQVSHVWGYKYLIEDLPTDKQLMLDLSTTIEVFNKLKSKINKTAAVNSISKILSTPDNKPIPVEVDARKFTLVNEPVPKGIKKKATVSQFRGRIIDHIKDNEEKTLRGKLAEEIILNNEVEKLADYNRINGSNLEPIWRSVTEGDGLGYDILSYDQNGEEIYIEVKSTTGSKNEPFYLTANELERIRQDDSKYFIYRVYELNVEQMTASYYILHSHIQDLLNFEPSVYLCSIK